jgi:pimeloyl-ACP methyl ester carboxylesterase
VEYNPVDTTLYFNVFLYTHIKMYTCLVVTLLYSCIEIYYYITYHYITLPTLSAINYIKEREDYNPNVSQSFQEYLEKEPNLDVCLKCISEGYPLTTGFLKRLFQYVMYHKLDKQLSPHQHKHIDALINTVKCRTTVIDSDDSHNEVKGFIAMGNLNPVYKPAFFYMLMWTLRMLYHWYLHWYGCKYYVDKATKLGMYVYHSADVHNIKTPIVFIHGMGIGSMAYIRLIKNLFLTQRTIIIIELPNISYCEYIIPHPQVKTIVDSLATMLMSLSINKVNIIGNSYGTIIQHVFNIKYPHMCNCNIYSDPVCFVINYGSLIKMLTLTFKDYTAHHVNHTHSLLYRNITSLIFRFIFDIVYRDIFIQFIINRTFFINHTFLHTLSASDMVIVGMKDLITPAAEIREYLALHHSDVKLIARVGIDHAEIVYNTDIYMKYINTHFKMTE